MIIDKFGRTSPYKFKTNISKTLAFNNFSAIRQYVDNKFNALDGYIIDHYIVGPNIDAQTKFLKFDTNEHVYIIPFDCKITRLRPSIPYSNIQFYYNFKPITPSNLLNKNLNKNDSISIEPKVPIFEPFDLFIYLKYKVL